MTSLPTTRPFSVLYVCTGNVARSPLAEASARALMSSNGRSAPCSVSSAGISAVEGECPRPEVFRAAEAIGVDVTAHRARRLTKDDCQSPDLILTMSWDQVAHIWSMEPESWAKCFTLKEFVYWAKQAAAQPPILFPDLASYMGDRVARAHAIRKRARSDHGFWGGLRPEDLDLVEPDPRNDQAWKKFAQAIQILVGDAFRLVGARAGETHTIPETAGPQPASPAGAGS